MFNLKYKDVIRWLLRAGTIEDPYIPLTEQVKIINNKTQLDEIPDEFHHVVINGLVEISKEQFQDKKTIAENEFFVNYQNGVIHFNPIHEGKTFTVEYWGRGVIQYPAERVYVHSPNPWVVDNLQEFIDFIYDKTKEFTEWLKHKYAEFNQRYTEYVQMLQDAYDDFVNRMQNTFNNFVEMIRQKYEDFVAKADLKIEEVDRAIDDAEIATDYAKIVGYLVKEQGEYAEKQGNRIEILVDAGKILVIELQEIKLEAIDATKQALQARDDCLDAYNRSILKWQNPVSTYADLEIVYPNPELGYTVLIEESGVVYRYQGRYWQPIGNLTLSVPLASETVDGLLSAVDFIKLRDIEEGAQVNYVGEEAKEVLPDYFRTKTICFVIPGELKAGEQDLIIRFPYSGKIVEVSASLGVEGTDSTNINIYKISKDDYRNKRDWVTILNRALFIDYGERIDDGLVEIDEENKLVSTDDHFKINITKAGIGAASLCVQIKIQI